MKGPVRRLMDVMAVSPIFASELEMIISVESTRDLLELSCWTEKKKQALQPSSHFEIDDSLNPLNEDIYIHSSPQGYLQDYLFHSRVQSLEQKVHWKRQQSFSPSHLAASSSCLASVWQLSPTGTVVLGFPIQGHKSCRSLSLWFLLSFCVSRLF